MITTILDFNIEMSKVILVLYMAILVSDAPITAIATWMANARRILYSIVLTIVVSTVYTIISSSLMLGSLVMLGVCGLDYGAASNIVICAVLVIFVIIKYIIYRYIIFRRISRAKGMVASIMVSMATVFIFIATFGLMIYDALQIGFISI